LFRIALIVLLRLIVVSFVAVGVDGVVNQWFSCVVGGVVVLCVCEWLKNATQ
jgi:hypothetical protein